MLICHPIPWNWNWVLDWVSVHPACYSLLILRRYPCIGIGNWIGPGLNESWFVIPYLGIGIGYWIGSQFIQLVPHHLFYVDTLVLELGIGLVQSLSAMFFDTPCMFTLELELCIGLAHSLDWPVCWFWSPTSELELGIGSGPSSSRKYVYQSFWHVYPWIGIRYWIGP